MCDLGVGGWVCAGGGGDFTPLAFRTTAGGAHVLCKLVVLCTLALVLCKLTATHNQCQTAVTAL